MESCALITFLNSFTFAQNFRMRCTVLITLLLLLWQPYSFAQRPAGAFASLTFPEYAASGTRDYFDTLMAGSFIPQSEGGLGCATGIYPADTGYVSGNNSYGDLQKAQFFSLHQMGYTAPGYVQDVQVRFGKKVTLSGTSVVFIKVYEVDTAGFWPGELTAVSTAVPVNSIDVSGAGNNFHFIAPFLVGDSFFVSVVLPTETGDSLAVLSSINNCRSFTAWSWEQWSNGSWHTIVNSWLLDMDLAIFPVVDLPFNVGVQGEPADRINAILSPNPASGQTQCSITLPQSGNVSITVLNELGSRVRYIDKGLLSPGAYSLPVDLIDLPDGCYYLVLTCGNQRRILPLVIQ